MSRETLRCAHLAVHWTTSHNADGTVSGWWECQSCGLGFVPEPLLQRARAISPAAITSRSSPRTASRVGWICRASRSSAPLQNGAVLRRRDREATVTDVAAGHRQDGLSAGHGARRQAFQELHGPLLRLARPDPLGSHAGPDQTGRLGRRHAQAPSRTSPATSSAAARAQAASSSLVAVLMRPAEATRRVRSQALPSRGPPGSRSARRRRWASPCRRRPH